jgi:hypothetical protein
MSDWMALLPIAILGFIGTVLGLYFARKERNEAHRTRTPSPENHTSHVTHS